MRSLPVVLAAIFTFALAVPAHAAWHEAKSRHFIIFSDDDPQRLHDFAVRLEKFDKAVRLVRGMDDRPLTDSRRLTIYALRNEVAIESLVGGSGARGQYQGRAAGSYAFVPRKTGRGDQSEIGTEAIFFHEYSHHLQLQQSSSILPVWYREGFAEFFATADIRRDGSVLIGAVPAYRAWSVFNDISGLSLEQILGQTYERLDGEQVGRLYAQGWVLTHFLTFEPSRKGQLARYLGEIQNGMSAAASARAAFGDLNALKKDLERYRKVRLTGVVVSANALSVGPVQLRPLTDGEAAIMNIHIRSTHGVTSKTAPLVAVQARKIAAAFPRDAFVQMALAEAEIDADAHAAADAAADRSIAANPNVARALIFKGRAQMALAKGNPARADWAAIRRWFLKANKVDTENAEALMMFYESFSAAGQRPTKNAVDALLYAAALAPQDDVLRLSAFNQLVTDNRWHEAKRMFAPIAFQPHTTSKWHDVSSKIMAALDRGDGKAVLALMEEAEKSAKEDSTSR